MISVCDSFRQQGVPEDALRLKAWLNALLSGKMASWNDLCQRFLLRYNPYNINAKLRNDISSFRQSEDETLFKAWERFKKLLIKCLMHGFQHCTQMEMFYNGLKAHTMMVFDASTNGTFLGKTYNEAYEILGRIANNDYQYSNTIVGIC
ncbi:protein FAR1-RELATED SEQUENCE 5-like [Gossypium australe]|uniref:Protein FAR1-RELATED SEQUENCE 5-like n=1 Tax=Gossypium australe TaxID=47621 RepID=A0A5B6UTG7_9ROSI|nr:protein FAR1-RELATED SEQUENCE 5-like [Gossypium australe]